MRYWLALVAIATGLFFASPAVAEQISGGWIFENAPDFPGFTRVVIRHDQQGWHGVVTSRWYGDMPMLDLRREGDTVVFHLSNGNPAVPMTDIVLRREAQHIRMAGKVWYQEFDIQAHKGSRAALKALDFVATTLPARRVVPQKKIAPTPPMGWSSWNKFATDIDDKTVREVADAMVTSGLRDAGYVYVNIDDGWQGTRDAQGRLQPNAKFPDMKALADYVHARGLKLGIYTSPGPKSCAGFEGTYGHVQQDAKTFAEWGIDYLKYDLCSGEAFYNTADTVYGTYQEMGEALAASGSDLVYSLCEYGRFDVGSWGRQGGGHLWRTTGDIEDSYAVMAKIGFDKNGVPHHTGPNGWNDPDMLEIGNGGMNETEYRTHLSLWAMLAAPLILGNDVRHMTPQTVALLTNKEVLAVDQDPAGAQGLPVKKDDGVEIWTKQLNDGTTAVALFNRNTTDRTVTGRWSDIALTSAGKIRDLWTRTETAGSDSYRYTVPAHGVVLLKVSR